MDTFANANQGEGAAPGGPTSGMPASCPDATHTQEAAHLVVIPVAAHADLGEWLLEFFPRWYDNATQPSVHQLDHWLSTGTMLLMVELCCLCQWTALEWSVLRRGWELAPVGAWPAESGPAGLWLVAEPGTVFRPDLALGTTSDVLVQVTRDQWLYPVSVWLGGLRSDAQVRVLSETLRWLRELDERTPQDTEAVTVRIVAADWPEFVRAVRTARYTLEPGDREDRVEALRVLRLVDPPARLRAAAAPEG